MHRITIGRWSFRYIVGNHTVGIVPPSRKKHIATIKTVRKGVTGPTGLEENGLADNRVSPEEIAAYIVAKQLM